MDSTPPPQGGGTDGGKSPENEQPGKSTGKNMDAGAQGGASQIGGQDTKAEDGGKQSKTLFGTIRLKHFRTNIPIDHGAV